MRMRQDLIDVLFRQALESWLEESARRDEDALTLVKYSKADESKIKVSQIVWSTGVVGGGRHVSPPTYSELHI